jgi:hypothetical protein
MFCPRYPWPDREYCRLVDSDGSYAGHETHCRLVRTGTFALEEADVLRVGQAL